MFSYSYKTGIILLANCLFLRGSKTSPWCCTRVQYMYHDRKAQTLSRTPCVFEPGDWGHVGDGGLQRVFAALFACYGARCRAGIVCQESWKPCLPPSGSYRFVLGCMFFRRVRFWYDITVTGWLALGMRLQLLKSIVLVQYI